MRQDLHFHPSACFWSEAKKFLYVYFTNILDNISRTLEVARRLL